MKTLNQIVSAIEKCEKAQLSKNQKMCPIWLEHNFQTCEECTCKFVFNWILEKEKYNEDEKC